MNSSPPVTPIFYFPLFHAFGFWGCFYEAKKMVFGPTRPGGLFSKGQVKGPRRRGRAHCTIIANSSTVTTSTSPPPIPEADRRAGREGVVQLGVSRHGRPFVVCASVAGRLPLPASAPPSAPVSAARRSAGGRWGACPCFRGATRAASAARRRRWW